MGLTRHGCKGLAEGVAKTLPCHTSFRLCAGQGAGGNTLVADTAAQAGLEALRPLSVATSCDGRDKHGHGHRRGARGAAGPQHREIC